MSEYTDVKQRKHKVIQTVRDYNTVQKPKECLEAAEREIVEELFKIFKLKAAVK